MIYNKISEFFIPKKKKEEKRIRPKRPTMIADSMLATDKMHSSSGKKQTPLEKFFA